MLHFFKLLAHHFHNRHQRRTIAVLLLTERVVCALLLNNCVKATRRFQSANAAIFRRIVPSTHLLCWCYIPRFAEQLTDVCAKQKNGNYFFMALLHVLLLKLCSPYFSIHNILRRNYIGVMLHHSECSKRDFLQNFWSCFYHSEFKSIM